MDLKTVASTHSLVPLQTEDGDLIGYDSLLGAFIDTSPSEQENLSLDTEYMSAR